MLHLSFNLIRKLIRYWIAMNWVNWTFGGRQGVRHASALARAHGGWPFSATILGYVVASLSPALATEIRDLILKPPGENPYNTIKEQLTKRTACSLRTTSTTTAVQYWRTWWPQANSIAEATTAISRRHAGTHRRKISSRVPPTKTSR